MLYKADICSNYSYIVTAIKIICLRCNDFLQAKYHLLLDRNYKKILGEVEAGFIIIICNTLSKTGANLAELIFSKLVLQFEYRMCKLLSESTYRILDAASSGKFQELRGRELKQQSQDEDR